MKKIRIHLGCFLAMLFSTVRLSAQNRTEKPNILFILTDDVGWGSVGAYGADPALVRTPNIDRLAEQGKLFTDAYAPSSVCSPTRYGVLTGRYCWRTSLRAGVLGHRSPLHIETDRMTVASMLREQGYATVRVQTTLRNDGATPRDFTLITRIQSGGEHISHTKGSHRLAPGESLELKHELHLPSPRRWSPDSPHLYSVISEVAEDGHTVDHLSTTFGVRTIAFNSEKGFLLNGESVNMKGVNLHMDGGAVGTAVPTGVWERRLRVLKEMGCNAIRIGHHPPAPEFLKLCDRIGFLVINEAFDKWDAARYWRHVNRHFADNWEADLVAMLRRDRNHPSIVLWSVGNENGLVWTQEFFDRYQSLADVVRREDPTRPVTAALRPIYPPRDNRTVEGMVEALAPMIEVLDVAMLNYQEHLYEAIRKRLPEVVIIGGESYGYFRGRGMNHKSDDEYNPWFKVEKHGWVAGQFLWPGIDYLGESTG